MFLLRMNTANVDAHDDLIITRDISIQIQSKGLERVIWEVSFNLRLWGLSRAKDSLYLILITCLREYMLRGIAPARIGVADQANRNVNKVS